MWCNRYTGNYEYTMNTNAALLECYGFSLLDRVEGVFTQVSVSLFILPWLLLTKRCHKLVIRQPYVLPSG